MEGKRFGSSEAFLNLHDLSVVCAHALCIRSEMFCVFVKLLEDLTALGRSSSWCRGLGRHISVKRKFDSPRTVSPTFTFKNSSSVQRCSVATLLEMFFFCQVTLCASSEVLRLKCFLAKRRSFSFTKTSKSGIWEPPATCGTKAFTIISSSTYDFQIQMKL